MNAIQYFLNLNSNIFKNKNKKKPDSKKTSSSKSARNVFMSAGDSLEAKDYEPTWNS